MTDLRALLGDRYDEVLTKATKRALFNYPNLPISIVEHEALAAQALAAVLPDLLAEANTRAEDAEAKARRFANLLGNNAKALNDTLPREVLRQKAAAWDEGADFVARHPGMSAEYIRAANSYRTRED